VLKPSVATQLGWVAGAGLEYKIFEHLLLRAEYLHYDLGKSFNGNEDLVSDRVTIDDSVARTTVDVIRGGLSYKF
jgi:opacity protein-like surface antigen